MMKHSRPIKFPIQKKKRKVQQVLDDCPDEKTPSFSALTEQNKKILKLRL